MDNIINVKNIGKNFGSIQAVNDISFQVAKGEVLGYLGPNGAGKSTTMKMLTCFIAPSSGTAEIMGHDIIKNPEMVKKLIGYLPENAPAYEDMTVSNYLSFIADIRGLKGNDKKESIAKVIEMVSLDEVLSQDIGTLSKGFKRRVGLAQCLIHDPEILILDEPTDGLDPNQKHEIRELIRQMSSEKVIILSTHILEEVEEVCTRAIIISHGKILADGTPKELKSKSSLYGVIHLSLPKEEASQAYSLYKKSDIIQKVEMTEDLNFSTLKIFPFDNKNIAHEVITTCADNNWEVLNLVTDHGSLSEVFRNITNKEVN